MKLKKYEQFLNENLFNNKIKYALEFIKDIIKDSVWENKVYLAGGGVRDEILNKDIKDIDLLINYKNGGILFAEWITKKLNIYKENSNPVIYPRFGTSKFHLKNQKYNNVDLSDVEIECIMPRKEVYDKNNRKPNVFDGDLNDDVNRRDFTINSLLKNLSNDELLDLTGMGKNDIENGIIRTTLNPDIIFDEDPLRMMRAVRFSVKYNWKLPLYMIKSIRKNSDKLKYISSERIQDELNKMLLTNNPDKAIRLLQITKLSRYIFPEIDDLINLKQNKYHKDDAMKHTLEVLKNTPNDLIIRLSGLLHDIGKSKTKEIIDNEIHFYKHEEIGAEMAEKILRRLKYPNEIINAVTIAISNHMRTKQIGNDANITERSLRKLKRDLGNHLQNTLELIHSDNISHSEISNMPDQIKNLKRKLIELDEKDKNLPEKPPLNGNDLINILNIKKGPLIGKILKYVDDLYLENPNLTKEDFLNIIKRDFL